MDNFKLWLDLADVAEYFNKSPITIRRWVQEKKIYFHFFSHQNYRIIVFT